MEREREFSIDGPVGGREDWYHGYLVTGVPAERCEGRKIFRSNSCRVSRDIDKVDVSLPSRTVLRAYRWAHMMAVCSVQ